MSKFIDELVSDLDNNPLTFKHTEASYTLKGYGTILFRKNGALVKDNIIITGWGNGGFRGWTSVIDVYVNGNVLTIERGSAKLERAVLRWFENIPLDHLKK